MTNWVSQLSMQETVAEGKQLEDLLFTLLTLRDSVLLKGARR